MAEFTCQTRRKLTETWLGELYRKQFPNLVDVCVRKAWQEDFYYALDQMNSYQMTAGRPQAFLHLFSVIEDNNLIRYSSVKRAVSTWIGIFDEKSIDRIRDKLLRLMGQKDAEKPIDGRLKEKRGNLK